jgi:hypothetical protein
VLQSPSGTTARTQRLVVQGCRNPSQRVAAVAQVSDFREHTLLARVGLDVLAVRAETEAEPNIPDPLPAGALVPQRIPRPFPDRFPLPLRDRRRDGDDQAARGRGRIELFRNRNQRDATLLEQFQ